MEMDLPQNVKVLLLTLGRDAEYLANSNEELREKRLEYLSDRRKDLEVENMIYDLLIIPDDVQNN